MVRVNNPGICSAVKSQPRRVRRSLSGTSLDVHGTVVMEKVWMFEGMTAGISTEQLSEEDTEKDSWCPKHRWFLVTNFLTSQHCAKCSKRILPKRAAYKCTACKRLCHLKCAADNSNSNTELPRLRPRKDKSNMDFQHFVPKEDAHGCRYARKTSNRRHSSRYSQRKINNNEIEEMEIHQAVDDWPVDEIDSADTMQQMADIPGYSDVLNSSRQSQARQKLSSMKHGFVKKCRSFKKKVKTFKDKVHHAEGNKQSNEQTKQDSTTTTSSTADDQVEQEREAWVRSPVRTRLRERQLELRRESLKTRLGARRGNFNRETSVQKTTIGSQMRNSKRHRFQIYDHDLVTLSDRLMEVEKRVNELETAIPQEIAEWHKLQQKFHGGDNVDDVDSYHRSVHGGDDMDAYRRRDTERKIEEQIIHETHPKHLEAMGIMPSVSSGTTSDDVYIVPDQQSSSGPDEPDHVMSGGHMVHDQNHMVHNPYNSLHEESLPSGIPGRLRLNLGPDTSAKQQTSTPVTDRELSFLSASRQYKNTNKIQHTNITQISVEHSYSDPNLTSKAEIKLERSISFEKGPSQKVLSPEQNAVKDFLQKRRKSSPRLSTGRMTRQTYTSPTRRKSRSPERTYKHQSSPLNRTGSRSRSSSPLRRTNQSSLYSSPPIASSTFQEDNFDSKMRHSDMSPLSFTLRHDRGDNSQYSFAKIDENCRLEGQHDGRDRNTSSNSNLSYTFRNDSQMIQTNAEEDLPGYTRNYRPARRQQSDQESEDTNSDKNFPHGTRMTFETDIEMDAPRFEVAKRDSVSTQMTATTDNGMSLTNVTAVTGDFINSFAETVNSSNRSRWVNKDVYMFERDNKGNPIRSKFTQSHEKVDATGDWKKPPVPNKRYSSASEIDFLKEAEKRLEVYKMRKSEEHLTAGMCLEKLPRSSVLYDLETDSEEEVKEHIVRGNVGQSYASPKHRSPAKQRNSSPKSRSSSPKRSPKRTPSPNRSPYLKRKGTSSKRSPSPRRKSPSSRRKQSPQRSSSPHRRSSSPYRKSPVLHKRSPNRSSLNKSQYSPTHNSPKKVNSTSEFEDFERQLQEESLKHHRRSVSLTNLQRYQHLPSSSFNPRENSMSCTNSVDGETRSLINDSARYHFLHDKGMIKISSPSLKILSGSPAIRRKYKPEYKHIDEESSDIVHSGSESGLSGVYVNNNFHLQGKSSSEIDSKQTQSEITETISNSSHKTGSLGRQQLQERELFEQCLKTADDNQEVWDHVLDWMNKERDDEEDAELEHELNRLMQQEQRERYETNRGQGTLSGSRSPVDDSVYYSFAGQSEELRGAISPLRRAPVSRRGPGEMDHDGRPGLMYIICNGTVQDVADYLNSDQTISEGEIKEALLWAIDEQNFDITLLLLEDICKLIHGAEGDTCIDVFPAYLEQHRWQPVFVILTRQNYQGEWDSFMGFSVYRRRYDLVSTESAVVINSNFVRSHPLSLEDFRTVKRAISSVNLQKYHSKITVINACPCRSRKDGQVLEKGLCIVIHCLIKGFIPFDEDPFPREINGIPVDVREGYFRHGVATPTGISSIREQLRDFGSHSGDESNSNIASTGSQVSECRSGSGSQNGDNSTCISGSSSKASSPSRKKPLTNGERSPRTAVQRLDSLYLDKDSNTKSCPERTSMLTDEVIDKEENSQHLQMGTSIGVDSQTGDCSLGGFILLSDGDIGFLTCSHILTQTTSSECVESYQPVYTRQNGRSSDRSLCGKVLKTVYSAGSCDSVGVDAAIVKVATHCQVTGEFIKIKTEQLKHAGYDHQNPPDFAKGGVHKFSELTAEQAACKVIKIGATTGLTQGQLFTDGLYVRQPYRLQDVHKEEKSELFNQFEVTSTPGTATRFFDLGDSGALVFLAPTDSNPICIGLAVGCTSYGSCVVTPIEAVFDALQLPHQFIDFTHCQSSF